MKYSIIIPCFNSEKVLQRTLDSCLNQTFKSFEVIAVDNGSADTTLEILRQYQTMLAQEDIKCTIIPNQKNLGPSYARNQGWDLAQGEYIAFLDHDDCWHSQKLEVIDRVLTAHPEIDCMGHAHGIFIAGRGDEPVRQSTLGAIKKLGLVDYWLRNQMVTPSLVIRRTITERFDPAMRYCEDHDLMLRVVRRHQVFYLDEPLVFLGRPVLKHGGQSADRWRMRQGEIHAYVHFAKETGWGWFVLPVLLVYSLLKHVRVMLK
ncbi:MAG: glycosyltransferase family 2 protein [Deltaproteobacteria bacterium]|nr:glycosyltransferase family 2 protein [Deltaproteobacteria bacterium]